MRNLSAIRVVGLVIVVLLLAALLIVPVQAGWFGAAKQSNMEASDASLLNASGKLTFLRVHDVGTGWGPGSDHLDVEVIFRLDTRPGQAFGFQLRDDGQIAARKGMLDLLRDAFDKNWTVSTDYWIDPGKVNGRSIRVWLTK